MTSISTLDKKHLSLDVWVTDAQQKLIIDLLKEMNIEVEAHEEIQEEEEVMTKEELMEGLREAFQEVKLHLEGKLELPSLKTKEDIRKYFDAL